MSNLPMMHVEGHLGGFIPAGDANTECRAVWDWFIQSGVKTVADVGCGTGFACEHFARAGCVVVGIDGSVAAEQLFRVPGQFLKHDYTHGPLLLEADLCWSCEFVEHVDQRYLGNFMATFAGCRTVAMTFAEPGQAGHHHVNCQPASYWIERFFEHGLAFDHATTVALRQIETAMHFKLRGLVFQNWKLAK
jgi:SAM-dependent methyltransferase